jgi:hypothetical protein
MPARAVIETEDDPPPPRERLTEMRDSLIADMEAASHLDPSKLQLLSMIGGALSALAQR